MRKRNISVILATNSCEYSGFNISKASVELADRRKRYCIYKDKNVIKRAFQKMQNQSIEQYCQHLI